MKGPTLPGTPKKRGDRNTQNFVKKNKQIALKDNKGSVVKSVQEKDANYPSDSRGGQNGYARMQGPKTNERKFISAQKALEPSADINASGSQEHRDSIQLKPN